MTSKVKICGICSRQAASDAVRASADYLGLIFTKDSKRYVEPSEAKEIARVVKDQCKLVGVFQDANIDFINQVIEMVGLDLVQLHGDENPDMCDHIAVPVIKTITIDMRGLDEESGYDVSCIQEQIYFKVEQFKKHCKYFLFDRSKLNPYPNYMETIVRVLGRLENICQYFIAGGLELANLPHVLGCLRPFGVDVASGVEYKPGVKDYQKMQLFCETVRKYSTNLLESSSPYTSGATNP